MTHSNIEGSEYSDLAPTLRTIFPELPEGALEEMFEGFVLLLGVLYDEYIVERRDMANREPPLDVIA